MLQRLIFHRYLEEEEQILYVGRSHVFRFHQMAFKPTFFFLILPALAYFVFQVDWLFMTPLWAIGAYLLIYRLLDWYGDGWVLTNQGVLDVKWDGFFHQHCLRLNYADFSGVTYESNGVLANAFGFGDVTIKMMNGEENVLAMAAHPTKLQKTILAIKNQLSLRDNRAEFETFRGAMHKMLADFFPKDEAKTATPTSPAATPTTVEITSHDKN